MLRTVVVTKPLVPAILFSTFPIFVLRAEAVTKTLTSDIFYQHLHFFVQVLFICVLLNDMN